MIEVKIKTTHSHEREKLVEVLLANHYRVWMETKKAGISGTQESVFICFEYYDENEMI